MNSDLDPAAPAERDDMSAAEYEAAKRKANFGDLPDSYAREFAPEAVPSAPTGLMPLDITKAEAFLDACVKAHVTYGLGAKVPFYHAVPGRDFTKVDCSGFVREAILEATEKAVPFPDGSVVQHDWVKARQYPLSSVDAAKTSDQKVRIAFLPPSASPEHIGHVVLIYQARTLESHGHHGPDSRPWDGESWQAHTVVYTIADIEALAPAA
jgi:hypothetical protein